MDKIKISIYVRKDHVEAITGIAESEGETRSAFIGGLISSKIKKVESAKRKAIRPIKSDEEK